MSRFVSSGPDAIPTERVVQRVGKDTTVFLQAVYSRFRAGISKVEIDSIGANLGLLLVATRESCNGVSRRPAGFVIDDAGLGHQRQERWIIEGFRGRMSARWWKEAGEYTLEVDTLADGATPSRPFWLGAARRHLPQLDDGYSIATECAEDVERPTGTVVAIGKTKGRPSYYSLSAAWRTSVVSEQGIRHVSLDSVPIKGILCWNTGLGRW